MSNLTIADKFEDYVNYRKDMIFSAFTSESNDKLLDDFGLGCGVIEYTRFPSNVIVKFNDGSKFLSESGCDF